MADELREAARDGDLEKARFLLARGADVADQDAKGRTALHKAASNGRVPMAEWLLKQKADPNITNESGQRPLHLPAFCGSLGVAQSLIAAGALILDTPLVRSTSLLSTEHLDLIRERESYPLHPLHKDADPKDTLGIAQVYGHHDLELFLMGCVLREAAGAANEEKVRQLLAFGNVNGTIEALVSSQCATTGDTALHKACSVVEENLPLVEMLVNAMAMSDGSHADYTESVAESMMSVLSELQLVANVRGQTPLDLATERGHVGIADFLKQCPYFTMSETTRLPTTTPR